MPRRRHYRPGEPGYRPCRHCSRRHAGRPRGLCSQCYYAPGVRDMYPVTSKFAPSFEPTEAEVERVVAEQYANLPDWWDKESRRQYESEGLL